MEAPVERDDKENCSAGSDTPCGRCTHLHHDQNTRAGAYASVITMVALWIALFARSWNSPDSALPGGVMPVAVILAASSVAMIVVSLLTRPPDNERLARFFPGRSNA